MPSWLVVVIGMRYKAQAPIAIAKNQPQRATYKLQLIALPLNFWAGANGVLHIN
jgi:hypothetical protein